MSSILQPGINHLLQQQQYKQLRLATVTNNAAFTSTGIPSRMALLDKGFHLVKLFSPEHGLHVQGADGAFQQDGMDSITKLPVVSLYGDRLSPTEEDLQDVDAVVFDIPDVGCRFYTYLWTMTYVMEACARYGQLLIIADRPNPTGGNLPLTEGPMLDETLCSSFIGRWRMPVRHCCTLGELARYFAATRLPLLALDVIRCAGWQRQEVADANSFMPTSPAIRDVHTAMLYPGTGLLEGVNVNEGRGTETPFRVCGAPWIDAGELQQALAARLAPSISCRIHRFRAVDGPYKGELCQGVRLQVEDAGTFHPVATGIALLQVLAQLYPQHLKQRAYPTRANPSGEGHLDKLLGVGDSFELIKNGGLIGTAVSGEWMEVIGDYMLY